MAQRHVVDIKTQGAVEPRPIVGIIGGSKNDFPVLKEAEECLASLGLASETRVISAHRTPDLAFEYARSAESRGLRVIIAGAGGAAHLAGVFAALTHLPIIGVPIASEPLRGIDALLSMVQMPRGVPVATVAIGGAKNAALLAAAILAIGDPLLRKRLIAYRNAQTRAVTQEMCNDLSPSASAS